MTQPTAARRLGGHLVRQPYGEGLSISAFGSSWECNHLPWLQIDGLILLPVPLDAPILVLDIRDSVDLDTYDRARVRAQLTDMVAGVDLQGARLIQASLHECFRSVRSAVYVVGVRPPANPPAAVTSATAAASDATVL